MKSMLNQTQTNGKKGLGFTCEQVWPGRVSRDPQLGPGRHPATAEQTQTITFKTKKRLHLTLVCWNVHTLLDIDNSDRPQRRTALVSHKLSRYGIDISALSETRLSDEGRI